MSEASNVQDGSAPEAPATPAPALSIRDRIGQASPVGTVRTVNVVGFGPVPVKVLSGAQARAVPEGMPVAQVACVDENGSLLYATPAEFLAAPWGVIQALFNANSQVNSIDGAAAQKK